MKNKLLFPFLLLLAMPALAVTPGEDVATTITLRGYQCGGPATDVQETQDAEGNKAWEQVKSNHRREGDIEALYALRVQLCCIRAANRRPARSFVVIPRCVSTLALW